MSTINELGRVSDVLMFEAGETVNYVRDVITVLSGTPASLLGQVMAKKVFSGTASETHAGNTGNGAMTIDGTNPVLPNAMAGVYTVQCITATANSGTFRIFDPVGRALGDYVVAAAAFADQIKFTIADGAADFIVGDKFLIAVGALVYKYVQVAPGGADGSQIAAAVLLAAVDASAGDATGVAVVRGPAVLKDAGLVWTSGMTSAQKLVAQTQLASQGMPVRTAYGV